MLARKHLTLGSEARKEVVHDIHKTVRQGLVCDPTEIPSCLSAMVTFTHDIEEQERHLTKVTSYLVFHNPYPLPSACDSMDKRIGAVNMLEYLWLSVLRRLSIKFGGRCSAYMIDSAIRVRKKALRTVVPLPWIRTSASVLGQTVTSADELLQVLQALAMYPAFSCYHHRLKDLASSVISHTLYREADRKASQVLTWEYHSSAVELDRPPAPEEATSPPNLKAVRQPMSDARADTSMWWSPAVEESDITPNDFESTLADEYGMPCSASMVSMDGLLSKDLIESDYVQHTTRPVFAHTNNIRPPRLSWMLIVPTDPDRLSEIKVKVVILQSWLDLYGLETEQQITDEKSAFPHGVHPEDIQEVYNAILQANTATPVYKCEFRHLCPKSKTRYHRIRSIGSYCGPTLDGSAYLLCGYEERMPKESDDILQFSRSAHSASLVERSESQVLPNIPNMLDSPHPLSKPPETAFDADCLPSPTHVASPFPFKGVSVPLEKSLLPDGSRVKNSHITLPQLRHRVHMFITCEQCVDALLMSFYKIHANKEAQRLLSLAVSEHAFDAHDFQAKFGDFAFGWLFVYARTYQTAASNVHIQMRVLMKVLFSIYRLHHDVPFHNTVHSLDALQAVTLLTDCIVGSGAGHLLMPPVLQFVVMFATVAVDMDHSGLSHDYLAGTDNHVSVLHGRECPSVKQASLLCDAVFVGSGVFTQQPARIRFMRDLIVGTQGLRARDTLYQLQCLTGTRSLSGSVRTERVVPSALSVNGGELGRVQSVIARSAVLIANTANLARPWGTAERFARNYMREEFASGILESTALGRTVLPLLTAYTANMRSLGLEETSAVAGLLLTQAKANKRECDGRKERLLAAGDHTHRQHTDHGQMVE
ncbi:hypothetical protein KIPB_003318 [Kipferlia bialata]|uniref:PDEase domain-containing protein n=1 Tax=Kipferlia bialata TaxID=797122 RepID=A0A9K3CTP4_9EUKA|nr:hypothetical protein KIPB_003318 [Kipferlia bialata]|eukprot:g3318.t1